MKQATIFTGLVNIDKNLVGTAVIYIKIAEILHKKKYQVNLVVPEISSFDHDNFSFHIYNNENNKKLINNSSLVIFGAYPPVEPLLYAYQKRKSILTYLWSVAPIGSLEFKDFKNLQKQSLLHQYITASYNLSLLLSDKIFCRSDKVRDLIIGSLISLGRFNLENYEFDKKFSFIEVAPFGIDEKNPKHKKDIYRGKNGIDKNDFLLIWNGGIWNWNDGETLIKAMNEIKSNKKVKLIFQGYKHPNSNQKLSEEAKKTIFLAKKLKLVNKNVFFADDWLPHKERGNYLTECNAGIVTSPNIPEANYFLKTRIYDYIWANLPVVINDCEAYADLVREYKIGIVSKTGDYKVLSQNITKLSRNKNLSFEFRKNINKFKKEISWEKALGPVENYLNKPINKKDKYNKNNLLLQKSIESYADLYNRIKL